MVKQPHDITPKPDGTGPLHAALEALPLGIIITDKGGKIIDANAQACVLLQLKQNVRQTLKGKKLSYLFPFSHGHVSGARLEPGETKSVQLREFPDLCVVTTLVKNSTDNVSLTILDKKLFGSYFGTAPSMNALNAVYKRISRKESEGVVIYDAEAKIVFANDRAAENIGIDRVALEGLSTRKLIESKFTDNHMALNVIVEKTVMSQMATYPRTGKTVCLIGYPIVNTAGNVILAVIVERDLTTNILPAVSLANELELITLMKREFEAKNLPPVSESSFVRNSPAMRKVLETAHRYSRNKYRDFLILGDPGTSPGMLARFIHDNSDRKNEPFVEIDGSSRDAKRLETLLFGSESGAGNLGEAPRLRHYGLLEAVGRGTVFIDNVQNADAHAQSRIMAYLNKHSLFRVGGKEWRKSRAFVIFGATAGPDGPGRGKKFMASLRDRLSRSTLKLPPLTSRKEDILDLAQEELTRLNLLYGVSKYLDNQATEILMSRDFKVNVRELLVSIHQAALFSATPQIGEFLRLHFDSIVPGECGAEKKPEVDLPPELPTMSIPLDKLPGYESMKEKGLPETMMTIEKKLILEAIADCGTTRDLAAILGISQSGVFRKLRKHDLSLPGKIPPEDQDRS
ncbi:MAG: sigma 54-interacting transcriptional regulator [Deltaproteobacteria bacterium]|jgi:DNA-binding NtrC family response regulator/PAS domain-containing protein|nr:sigma 54-interacting transcriptional regulator [Deltaproteobacteria bacterium]